MKFGDDPMNYYGRHKKGFENTVSDAYGRCFNNIVFASQMSHKNVLKLIGCCLETQIPILVFEAVEDYNLSYRMEVLCVAFPLSHRFKVAMEIANAIAYLHVGFPRPIIFRIIKPTKILFDESGVAKLSDFSECVVIPDGETHVKDATLIGTDGILSPEYINTGYWDEKCDVYSFGVLILVLFTGESLYRFNHHKTGELPEIQEYLDELYALGTGEDYLKEVKKYIESSRLVEVMDQKIVEDESYPAKEQELHAFAELGLLCVSESPENWPTMVEVAKQLRQLYLSCS